MGFYPVKITEVPREDLNPSARAKRHSKRLGLISRAAATVFEPPKKVGRVRVRRRHAFHPSARHVD